MVKLQKSLNQPTILFIVLAGLFLLYLCQNYGNKKSSYLAPFTELNHPTNPISKAISTVGNVGESVVDSVVPSSFQGSSKSLQNEISNLLPNGETPNLNNLLEPHKIIGMSSQVKRNQTFDLRGNIPIPKSEIPFNNSPFSQNDVTTTGIFSIQ